MKKIALALIGLASIANAQTASWAQFTHSGTTTRWGYNHYFDLIPDPVSHQLLFWSAPGWTGGTDWTGSPAGNVIYSSWFAEYKPNTTFGTVGTFTGIEPIGTSFYNNWGNSATNVSPCPADVSNFPSMMHPVKQIAIDTRRLKAMIGGSVVGFSDCFPGMTLSGATATASAHFPPIPSGVAGSWVGKQVATSHNGGSTFSACPTPATVLSVSLSTMVLSNTTCDQTATSIQLLDTGGGSPRQQLYSMTLNSNPASNTFTRRFPYGATNPDDNYLATWPAWSSWAMEYDPDDDVLITYGGRNSGVVPQMWVWCETDLNPGNTLTARQTAAGCTTGLGGEPKFTLIVPVGWDGTCGPTHPEPCTYNNTSAGVSIRYDTVSKKFWTYNGSTGSGGVQGLWMYDVPTQTWTQKCTGGCTLPPDDGAREVAGSSNYNQTPWVYSPLTHLLYTVLWDSGASAWKAYYYTPATDRWTQITLSGTAPTGNSELMIGYDYTTNRIVAKTNNNGVAVAPAQYYDVFELQLPQPSFSVDLTLAAAVFTGSVADVDRFTAPFCLGVPIPDSAGLTSTSTLGLGGQVSAGQFQITGSWPSGNIKTLKVCGVSPFKAAGVDQTVTLHNGGTGNFGGSDLAVDNGSTITVTTGTVTVTVKKANFNGLDVVDVGSSHIVLTGESDGFSILGPDPTATYPGNVTCSPATGGSTCATTYASKYDSSSTVAIVENGPAETMLKATWTYKDSGGTHSYLKGAAYIYFTRGSNSVKVTPVLINSDYGTSSTFATAFKGLRGYELKTGLNITAGNDTLANHTGTPTTASITSSDDVYLYQGLTTQRQFESNTGATAVSPNEPHTVPASPAYTITVTGSAVYLADLGVSYAGGAAFVAVSPGSESAGHYSRTGAVYTFAAADASANVVISYRTSGPWTYDQGYTVRKNASTTGLTGTTSGTSAQTPAGWADIDSSGAGVQLGVYWLGFMGSKSLEYTGVGGKIVARIGILAPQNALAYYPAWPQWLKESDIWLNFHAAAVVQPANRFQEFQAELLGRASVSYYNSTGVFPYPMVDALTEDTYETTVAATALPATIPGGNTWSTSNVTNATDTSCSSTIGSCPVVWRYFPWDLEFDYRYDYMMTFLQRGWAGPWLMAKQFYDFYSEYGMPHAQGTDYWWNHWDSSNTEVDAFSRPKATAANAILGLQGVACGFPNCGYDWHDQEHGWWMGQVYYYYLTGDAYHKDAIINQEKNWYLAPHSAQAGGYQGSNEVTTVSGNSTITLTCCTSWNTEMVGQNVGLGTAPNYTFYRITAVTDGTHFVVSPTPSASATNVPILRGPNALSNPRSVGNNLANGAAFADFLRAIGDSDYTTVQQLLKNIYYLQVDPDVCQVTGGVASPAGCSPGTVLANGGGMNGVNRKRGTPFQNSGFSDYWCGNYPTGYREEASLESAILVEGVLALRNSLGTGWADYWNSLDLAYGVTTHNLTEMWASDGTGHWDTNNWIHKASLDSQNNCSAAGDLYTVSTNGTTHVVNVGSKDFSGMCGGSMPCSVSLSVGPAPLGRGLFIINGSRYQIVSVQDANNLTLATTAPTNASQTAIFTEFNWEPKPENNVMLFFAAANAVEGGNSWEAKLKNLLAADMAVGGRTGIRDFQSHYETQAIYHATNPGTKTLQALTPSVVENSGCAAGAGSGHYCVSWTTPASTDLLRVKYAASPIVDWIGADPGAQTWTGTSTNTNWFAASNATSIPAPVTGAQSMAINVGTTGLVAANFSVKAMFPAGCVVSPTSLGQWTVGQVISQTMTASGCGGGTLTWTSSGLPAGLSGCNSVTGTTCLISGTLTTATTYSPSIAVSDGGSNSASINPTVVVNAAPSISTSSLPAHTTGYSYSQSLTTSGGTSPITCALFSGSLTGSGVTLNSNCTLTGTLATVATYTLTAKATDSNSITGAASSSLGLTINPAPTITTTSLPAVTSGSVYNQTLATAGGTGSAACALFSGSLSGSGLTLNSNCTITGTAATAATYTLTGKATDGDSITGAASSSLSILVNPGAGSGGTAISGKVSLTGKH